MPRRRTIELVATVWAVVGATIALGTLTAVDADARLFVATAAVVFPLCAATAVLALRRGHDRLAGALLVLSAATPTYFAWVLNVPALVVGAFLAAGARRSPRRIVG